MSITIGIDCALTNTGIAVIKRTRRTVKLLHHSTIKTSANDVLAARLKLIGDGVRDVAIKYKPTRAVVEDGYVGPGRKIALLLGAARGTAVYGLLSGGVDEIALYAPSVLKKSMTGRGDAGKAEMIGAARRTLKLESGYPLNEHEADAIAAALYSG